ncbi:amidase domain-containing protein [Nocardioides gilvus]|uniref:amidase domain-containing protein n=1 Tax=Nocardioides gilvus TaxID=1735589 RepID=UPI0013A5A3C2|nr:amidase domain-containing protein [Nocardioides gilvus]
MIRLSTAGLVATIIAFLTTTLTAPSAHASDNTYVLAFTAGTGAYPRSIPVYDARVGTALPQGSTIVAACWAAGDDVTSPGGYTSDIWILDPSSGYFSEAWLETGSFGVPVGLPECEVPVSNSSESDDFDRHAAVAWALSHVTDPQPIGVAGCTWFVSQALWAGGMSQDVEWNGTDVNGRFGQRQGSATAWLAEDLVEHLVATKGASLIPMDFSGNAVPEATPGDVVAYDWESDGVIDHLALIVDIDEGDYPLVSEWGTVDWYKGNVVAYDYRGWTYSEKNQAWLQEVEPDVSAQLVRFN